MSTAMRQAELLNQIGVDAVMADERLQRVGQKWEVRSRIHSLTSLVAVLRRSQDARAVVPVQFETTGR